MLPELVVELVVVVVVIVMIAGSCQWLRFLHHYLAISTLITLAIIYCLGWWHILSGFLPNTNRSPLTPVRGVDPMAKRLREA